MSTKSGIVASEGLLDAFKNISTPLVICVSEDNTQLVPDDNAPKFGTELADNFDQLNRYLDKIFPRPAYVVVPHEDTYGFISFIPDLAPVREKMLYASTKNTLMMQLGTSNFKNKHIFAWTEPGEVSHSNFVHGNETEAVLSLDEKLVHDLANIQTLDRGRMVPMESLKAGGMLLFQLSLELEAELANVAEKTLVVFDIDIGQETVNLVDSNLQVTTLSLINHLDSIILKDPHPIYAVYKYGDANFAFIYCCPSGSKVKERMIYASNKQGLINHIKGIVLVDKVIDAGDVHEIEVSSLLGKQDGETGGVKRISRPKGPRRR